MKSGGKNGSTKNFMVSVKPNTQYRPKAKQSIEGTSNSPKTTPFVGTNKASTSGYNKNSPSNKGSKATTSGTQEEGQSFTPIVNKISVLKKQILDGKLMFVNDDRKPLEKVDYMDNLGSNDEVEPVKNEMTCFLASKPMGVGYGPKSLLEQWIENNVDDDHDPYDDDMYEGRKILENIQTICDNLDIKVRGWKKK
ncbi:hypothetical protein Tco_0299665 [Tanacetum coccineum]